MITLSELSNLLDRDRALVKDWTTKYAEHLSEDANPPQGNTRRFRFGDLRAMKLIADCMRAGVDEAEIHRMLQEPALIDSRMAWAYKHSPLFHDPPDGIDEDSYGAVLGGMASRQNIDVARSYWNAAKVLLNQIWERGHTLNELDYPILFLTRHAIELYLKALLTNPPEHHDINELVNLLEAQLQRPLTGWIAARLRDFHQIDLRSDYFRYGGTADGEFWVDFHHLQSVMDWIFEACNRL